MKETTGVNPQPITNVPAWVPPEPTDVQTLKTLQRIERIITEWIEKQVPSVGMPLLKGRRK